MAPRPAACAPRGRPAAGRRKSGAAWCWACATPGQERLSRRHHRPVRRHRLGRRWPWRADALGATRAVMMPSRSRPTSSTQTDADDMARRLGMRYDESPSRPARGLRVRAARRVRRPRRSTPPKRTSRPRARHAAHGAVQQDRPSLVLTTGNRSEMTGGYRTLYGDMAGGFAGHPGRAQDPGLRAWRSGRNTQGAGHPRVGIITRPPSAELRPDQTDPDSPAALRRARRHHGALHGAQRSRWPPSWPRAIRARRWSRWCG